MNFPHLLGFKFFCFFKEFYKHTLLKLMWFTSLTYINWHLSHIQMAWILRLEDGAGISHQEFQRWRNGGGTFPKSACIDLTVLIEMGAIVHPKSVVGAYVHIQNLLLVHMFYWIRNCYWTSCYNRPIDKNRVKFLLYAASEILQLILYNSYNFLLLCTWYLMVVITSHFSL